MKERNILVVLLLSIITCSIYFWIVMFEIQSDLNQREDEEQRSPGIAILLSFITCGIYTWYWLYKMSSSVDKIKGTDNAIITLILGVFLSPTAGLLLLQHSINKQVD